MIICPYCKQEIKKKPGDEIDYCTNCEIIVEGEAEDITMEAYMEL